MHNVMLAMLYLHASLVRVDRSMETEKRRRRRRRRWRKKFDGKIGLDET